MLKIIDEFPEYTISEFGRIFKGSKEIKRQKNVDGYWVVNLYKDGKYYHRRCARLVGLTYLKESYSEGLIINHKDLDITNDAVSNLEWVSHKYNAQHSILLQPEIHRKPSEYTDEFIHSVCKMIEEGIRNVDIIKETGITRDVLHDIRSGETWTFISRNYKLTKSNKGISKNTAAWACERIAEGMSYQEILKISTCHNLTIHVLKHIKSKKCWKHVSDLYF